MLGNIKTKHFFIYNIIVIVRLDEANDPEEVKWRWLNGHLLTDEFVYVLIEMYLAIV